ncbi:hypothetical protein E3U23_09275 [Erythrobacter litoralis]|uniref:hypothetical protein n=1 Tax=Erythrobacter litoralis TaxID=39960 RepID=UPI00243541EC|nr:hypothetical protein [Erythrobacter litoralis]MDG6079383.1 hypothetical protein [Erythrobacter litoralis]
MTDDLADRVWQSLDREVAPEVEQFAEKLGIEHSAQSVLFYGSNLRTGSLDGVLDFYILLPGAQIERIWPRIGYREYAIGGAVLRAKIAVMSLEKFHAAAAGETRDTTIWTRFVQPATLVYRKDMKAELATAHAIAAAAMTASRMAAALGPHTGTEQAFWRALFRETYRSEFRIEKPGRENAILELNADHFDGLLAAAWDAQSLPFRRADRLMTPILTSGEKAQIASYWSARRRLGKPLNIMRLAKAALTFDGAADYAAWKLERHTGFALEVTRFRREHPLLAMPGAGLELWHRKRRSNQR